MDFFSNFSTSLPGPEATGLPSIANVLHAKSVQSPVNIGLTAILGALVVFLVQACWRPKVHPQSPAFTKDKLPLIGSIGFIIRGW